jgi:hypothetical protein
MWSGSRPLRKIHQSSFGIELRTINLCGKVCAGPVCRLGSSLRIKPWILVLHMSPAGTPAQIKEPPVYIFVEGM